MLYGIVVRSDRQPAQSALEFAAAALKQGHKIHRVFFFGFGALNACTSKHPSLSLQWLTLQLEHQLDLVICVTSAHKHQVVDPSTPSNQQQAQLAEGFTLSGLGQLADMSACCDRVITFR